MTEIRLPDYTKNKGKYHIFIMNHKKEIVDDSICNSDVIIGMVQGGEDLSDINFGDYGEIEEVVYHVLQKRNINCEYIPRGYYNIGIGYEGQRENIIEVPDDCLQYKEIKELMNKSLVW